MRESKGIMRPHTKGSRACRLCRDQKRRCNGEHPCNLCVKKNVECIFEPWVNTNHSSPSSQKQSGPNHQSQMPSTITSSSGLMDQNRIVSDSEALYNNNGTTNGHSSLSTSSSMSNIGPMRTKKLTSQIRTNPMGTAPTPPDSHSISRPTTHSTENASSPRLRHPLPSWHTRSPFNIPSLPNNPYSARSPHGSSLPGSTSVHSLPPPSLPHYHQPQHFSSHSGPTPGGSSSHTDSPDNRAANVQSNSGVLFAASIAADLGAKPSNGRDEGPFIAWNLGLRNACSTSSAQPQVWSQVVHRRSMMMYLETYENVMHPIYRFINVDEIAHLIDSNHGQDQRHGMLLDAIMCGIAAIGSLFSDTKDMALETALEQNVRAILDAHAEDEHHLPEAACAWLLRTLYLRASKVPHACWHASCIVMHACERARLHVEETVSLMKNTGTSPVLDPRRTYHVAKLLNTWISFELGRTHVSLARASTMLPDMSDVGSESSTTMLHLFDLSLNLEPSATPSHERLLDILQEVVDVPCPSPVVVLSQAMVVLSIVRRLRFGLGLQLSTDTTALILAIGQKGMACTNEILNTNAGPWWHLATLPYQVLCTVMALNTRKALTLVPTVMDTIRNAHSRYPTQMMDRILKRSLALVQALHKHKLDDARLLSKALGRGQLDRQTVADVQSGAMTGMSPSQMAARTPPAGTGNGHVRSHTDQDLPAHMIRQQLFSSNTTGSKRSASAALGGGGAGTGNVNGTIEKSSMNGGGSGMVWEGKRIDLEDWLVNIDWDSIMQNTEPTFFDTTGTV